MNLFEFYHNNTQNNQKFELSNAFIRLLRSIPQNHDYCRSRTFFSVLQRTVSRYSYNWYSSSNAQEINAYYLLGALSSLGQSLLHTDISTVKPIKLYAQYLDQTEISTNFTQLIENLKCSTQQDETKIHVVYVPRNKTALKEVLEQANTERIPQIEMLLIENVKHFIRILKINTDDIYIFTNLVSDKMIQMLYTLFPKLINLKELENPEQLPAITTINQTIKTITDIHAIFYNSVYDDIYKPEDISEIARLLKLLSTHFINPKIQQQNFATNLANRRNDVIRKNLINDEKTQKSIIEDLEKRLATAYEALAQTQRKLLQLKQTAPDDVAPLLNAINNNPAIETLDSTPNLLTLRITAPLQYYDPEDYKAYVNNPNSKINTVFSENEKEILYETFITRKYGIILQAIIHLELTSDMSVGGIRFAAQQGRSADFTEIPNPHLFYYNCWSEARSQIAKALSNNDYELIIPQLIAAIQSINVAEGASFVARFLNDIRSDTWADRLHFIEYATNEKYTFKELIIKHNTQKLEQKQTEGYQQIVLSENDEDDDPLSI